MAELVDALVSNTNGCKSVSVRVRPPVLIERQRVTGIKPLGNGRLFLLRLGFGVTHMFNAFLFSAPDEIVCAQKNVAKMDFSVYTTLGI